MEIGGHDGAAGTGARPDLGVVLRVHDHPDRAAAAIASIAAQDHPGRIETIVVWDRHDPAPDAASDHPRRPVRVLLTGGAAGPAASHNLGADASTAAVLGFCGDGDRWHPTRARRQLDQLDRAGVDVCAVGATLGDGTRARAQPARPTGVIRYRDLLEDPGIESDLGTVLIRRRSWTGGIGPLDETLPGGHLLGHDLLLRAARQAPVAVVTEPLVVLAATPAPRRTEEWRAVEQSLTTIVRRHPDLARTPRGRARLEGRTAFAIAAQGRRRDALDRAVSALRWSWREPFAARALLVASGVPARWLWRPDRPGA